MDELKVATTVAKKAVQMDFELVFQRVGWMAVMRDQLTVLQKVARKGNLMVDKKVEQTAEFALTAEC